LHSYVPRSLRSWHTWPTWPTWPNSLPAEWSVVGPVRTYLTWHTWPNGEQLLAKKLDEQCTRLSEWWADLAHLA